MMIVKRRNNLSGFPLTGLSLGPLGVLTSSGCRDTSDTIPFNDKNAFEKVKLAMLTLQRET